MEKFWAILKKSIGGFLGVTGFLLSLVMVPIYLFFFLKERPHIEATVEGISAFAGFAFEGRGGRGAFSDQHLYHRLFSRSASGLPGGWNPHWQRSDFVRIEFCPVDRRPRCRSDHDPLHRDHSLLGSRGSDCGGPIWRLVASVLGYGHISLSSRISKECSTPRGSLGIRSAFTPSPSLFRFLSGAC